MRCSWPTTTPTGPAGPPPWRTRCTRRPPDCSSRWSTSVHRSPAAVPGHGQTRHRPHGGRSGPRRCRPVRAGVAVLGFCPPRQRDDGPASVRPRRRRRPQPHPARGDGGRPAHPQPARPEGPPARPPRGGGPVRPTRTGPRGSRPPGPGPLACEDGPGAGADRPGPRSAARHRHPCGKRGPSEPGPVRRIRSATRNRALWPPRAGSGACQGPRRRTDAPDRPGSPAGYGLLKPWCPCGERRTMGT